MIRVLAILVFLSGCAAERQVFKKDPIPVTIIVGLFVGVINEMFVE